MATKAGKHPITSELMFLTESVARAGTDGWLLQVDGIAFVTEYTRKQPEALEHILDELHWDRLRCRCAKLEFEHNGLPDECLAYGRRFFWRKYLFVQHDLVNS